MYPNNVSFNYVKIQLSDKVASNKIFGSPTKSYFKAVLVFVSCDLSMSSSLDILIKASTEIALQDLRSNMLYFMPRVTRLGQFSPMGQLS
jgi:hypothetical protein